MLMVLVLMFKVIYTSVRHWNKFWLYFTKYIVEASYNRKKSLCRMRSCGRCYSLPITAIHWEKVDQIKVLINKVYIRLTIAFFHIGIWCSLYSSSIFLNSMTILQIATTNTWHLRRQLPEFFFNVPFRMVDCFLMLRHSWTCAHINTHKYKKILCVLHPVCPFKVTDYSMHSGEKLKSYNVHVVFSTSIFLGVFHFLKN